MKTIDNYDVKIFADNVENGAGIAAVMKELYRVNY